MTSTEGGGRGTQKADKKKGGCVILYVTAGCARCPSCCNYILTQVPRYNTGQKTVARSDFMQKEVASSDSWCNQAGCKPITEKLHPPISNATTVAAFGIGGVLKFFATRLVALEIRVCNFLLWHSWLCYSNATVFWLMVGPWYYQCNSRTYSSWVWGNRRGGRKGREQSSCHDRRLSHRSGPCSRRHFRGGSPGLPLPKE